MATDKKSTRLLDLYGRLVKGEAIQKRELARQYGVSEKSIQRDFNDLRAYLSEKHLFEKETAISYDPLSNSYHMERPEGLSLTAMEIVTVAKILLESRALNEHELGQLLHKLILQEGPEARASIQSLLLNEQYHYEELTNAKPLIHLIWTVSGYIQKQKIISIAYTRQDGKGVRRTIRPVALVFSDYYFYLVGYIEGLDKDSPAVFRLDRCEDIRDTGQTFHIPYRDRFSAGDFRNRVQFMYPGELIRVRFRFWGSSLDAVLDRLPTARIVGEKDGRTTVEAEVYGKGIKMWLLSQMEFLEVLEPASLREDILKTVDALQKIYHPEQVAN